MEGYYPSSEKPWLLWASLNRQPSIYGIINNERFEKRITEATAQQIKMYACAEGECSNDTPKGGVYSKNPLETSFADESEFIYFGRTHVTASDNTTRVFRGQHPEIIQPKLLTTQQLIF